MHKRRWSYRSKLALIMGGLLAGLGSAQAADGPGAGTYTFTAADASSANEYKLIQSTCNGVNRNNSFVFMHRGYMLTVAARDSGKTGGSWEVWNLGNPASPTKVASKCDTNTDLMREMHNYGVYRDPGTSKEYFVGLTTQGIQFWDITDPLAITFVKSMTLPGVTADDYNMGAWWVSWVGKYIYVGGTSNGMYIVDAGNPTAPVLLRTIPKDQLSTSNFRANVTLAIGNILMVGATDTTGKGMALFDLSDPNNPVQKYSYVPTADSTYHYMMQGKWNDPNTLLIYSANGDNTGLWVRQVSSDLKTVTDVYKNAALINQKIGYMNYQDGYIITGWSDNTRKLDVRNPASPSSVMTKKQYRGGATISVDEDFGTVIGNMIFSGNDHDGSNGTTTGSVIYVHQAAPDTTPPAVSFITPRNGSTVPVTSRVGVIMTDNIDIRSITSANFKISLASDPNNAAIAGAYSTAFGQMNFQPTTAFSGGTTYKVTITGIKDWAGNAMTSTWTSTFTAATNANAPAACNVGTDVIKYTGASVTATATGCTGTPTPTCTFDFGDGYVSGSVACATGASHTYTVPNHYTILVHATNSAGDASFSRRQTVVNQPTTNAPTRSTPIAYADPNTQVWGDASPRLFVVNPDRNSVRGFTVNATTGVLTAAWEKNVGRYPRSLAVRPGKKEVWVISQDDPYVTVLDGTNGNLLAVMALKGGSRPYGIAFTPGTGKFAFVTLQGTGEVITIDPVGMMGSNGYSNLGETTGYGTGNGRYATYNATSVPSTLSVGGQPRGIAVSADGAKLYVTRLITPMYLDPNNKPASAGGQVRVVTINTTSGALTSAANDYYTIINDTDVAHDSESSGRGVANYLQGITISPDGTKAAVASKKDNIFRGTFVDGKALNFENTVRTIVSLLPLTGPYSTLPATDYAGQDPNHPPYRRDINNADMANSSVYTSNGDWIFVAMHGAANNHSIGLYDALNYNGSGVIAMNDTTGIAPQGLVLSPDNKFLYVWAFMSRKVEVYDVSSVGTTTTFPQVGSYDAQSSEALSASVLAGKQIFYNAANPKMSNDSYIACSSCHLEGGGDETLFDFTSLGEGLRNTITMFGRRGMGHGPVHWSGNFDEIQDFEHPIRDLFAGTGFMLDSSFNTGTRNTPLGDAKAGVSTDLDNMAAYVATLTTVPRSPNRNADGTMTAAAVAGRTTFAAKNCGTCHSGRDFTDSASKVLHDVGTMGAGSGKRLNGTLTGIDTPTLLGVWNTAPYLHNGKAADLDTVLANTTHVGTLTTQEKSDLKAYLGQLDDMVRDFNFTNLTVSDPNYGSMWSFKSDLNVGDYAYPDRAYNFTAVNSFFKDSLWLRSAAMSKYYGTVNATNETLATFTVDKMVDVYVLIDTRAFDAAAGACNCVDVPEWLANDGWERQDGTGTTTNLETGTITHFDGSNVYYHQVWKKTFPAGTVTLKTHRSNSFPVYTTVIKATPPGNPPARPTGVAASAGDTQVSLSWIDQTDADDYTVQMATASTGPFTTISGASHIAAASYVATGLTNGIQYWFQILANNEYGASAASTPAATATPTCSTLSAPTGLAATAGQAQATLTWNAVAGATGYNIKRGTSTSATPPTVATASQNVLTNTGLTAGTTYYFRVSATNSCGESANSAEVTVTPVAVAATNALLISVDRDSGTAGLQLTPGDALIKTQLEALGYTVTAVQDSASASSDATGKNVVFISGSVNPANVLAKFDTVTVPVMVSSGGLMSDMRLSSSEAADLTTETMMTVSNSSSLLASSLTGDVVVNDAQARLTKGTALASADKVFTQYGNSAVATEYAYASGAALATGTAPARRVAFFFSDADGNIATCSTSTSTACHATANAWDIFGDAVNWASGAGGSAPAAPTNLAADPNNVIIKLTWTASAGASNYKVYRGDTAGGPYAPIATVATTTYTDQGVVTNHAYYYVVTATNTSGESGNSNEVLKTIGCTAPGAPTISATAGNGQVNLSWAAINGANTYNIKRGTSTGTETVVATGVTQTAYANTGLTNGTAYFFKVSAVSASCGEGTDSNEVSATPTGTAAPGAPTGLTATAGVPFGLSWTAATGTVTSYEIWRGTTTGGETLLTTVGVVTTYSDAAVNINTTYYYKVRALNGTTAGSYSSEVSGATGTTKMVNLDQDAFVRDGTATGNNCNAGNGTNCGQATADSMAVKLGTAGNMRFYFVRIPLTNVPAGTLPATTKLRMYGNCATGAKTLNVYKITNTNWAEGTITYTSADGTTPKMTTEVQAAANKLLGVSVGTTAANVDWSGTALTTYIQTQKASNPTGYITLGISYDVANNNDSPCGFNRREAATNFPQLRVE